MSLEDDWDHLRRKHHTSNLILKAVEKRVTKQVGRWSRDDISAALRELHQRKHERGGNAHV